MTGTYIISKEQEGQRLDVALSSFFPALSLREVRRAWGLYLVEVNHKHARKGMFVKAGDKVSITAIPEKLEQLEPGGEFYEADNENRLGVNVQNLPETHRDNFVLQKGRSKQGFVPQPFPEPDLSLLRILHRENGIIAIFKPAGLHSAHVQGGGLSLEQLLPDICTKANIDPAGVELFNRLDCLTSGIVLATENALAQQKCLQAEKEGKTEKRYLALVRGQVFGEFWVKNSLDTDSRRKTKVLAQINPDPLRHTLVRPIHLFFGLSDSSLGLFNAPVNSNLYNGKPSFSKQLNLQLEKELEQGDLDGKGDGKTNLEISSQNACLLEVSIFQGARHQIRAHLASVGFPILGDPLYDPNYEENLQGLCLHHFAISLPDFLCITPPPWPMQGSNAKQNELECVLRGLFPGLYNFI